MPLHKAETARRLLSFKSISDMGNCTVNDLMNPSNIKTEVRNYSGNWEEISAEVNLK